MKTKKKVWIIVGTLLILTMAFMAPMMSRMPSPQADRIDGNNIVGIDAGGSYSWVIPTKTGVVLVDAGWDNEGKALKAEIGDRKVHAILITHGHFDHTGGLALFPEATVYIGPDEAPLLKGEAEAGGWMARMSTTMMNPSAYTPAHLQEFKDGDVIEIDGDLRVFLQQLRLFDAPKSMLELALKNYYRAFEQRNKWTVDGLLNPGELGIFDQKLEEQWQEQQSFLEIFENLETEQDKKRYSAKLYQACQKDGVVPIRPEFIEGYLSKGSYHILADKLQIGWHPEFEKLAAASEGAA